MAVLRDNHLAMRTQFEAILVGDDPEHLGAVMTLVWEEIDRVERLLSRYDPAAEVYRVNRQAHQRPVKLSVELTSVLAECIAWHGRTQGAFDVVAANDEHFPPRLGVAALEFDEAARTLAFRDERAQLDFGGYGKGYALDRAIDLLKQYGIEDAFLHGGTSSIAAIGNSPAGTPWQVDVAGRSVAIVNQALSTSASYVDGGRTHSAIHNSGAIAEILSTVQAVIELSAYEPTVQDR